MGLCPRHTWRATIGLRSSALTRSARRNWGLYCELPTIWY